MTTPADEPRPPLMRDEVAKRLRVGVDTLKRMIATGEFPHGIPVSAGVLVWTEEDVEAHLYRVANRHRFRVHKPKPAAPREKK